MWDWEDDQEFLNEMLDAGCIDRLFTDEDGELCIEWNLPNLEELYPDIYAAFLEIKMEELEESISSLIDEGYVQMSFRENPDGTLEALYSLTDKGREYQERFGKVGGMDWPS